MRLRRLELHNFRQHRSTTIEFDTGLTGIIGPNGAGKSTILEAIAWALYGNSAARGMRDSIRFHRAPPRSTVRVSLDFELAGHSYRVVRGLTSAELYLDDTAEPIANTISGVAESVHRRLGMTRGEFFNTYFSGQNELNVMSAMKPTERAQFLSRVLGYERLRTAQDLVRDKRRLHSAEISGIRTAMRDPEVVARAVADAEAKAADMRRRFDDAERARISCEEHLAELSPRWENAQKERDRLLALQTELRVAESELASARREADRLARDSAEVEMARLELEQLVVELVPLERVSADFERLEALARHDGRRRALEKSQNDLTEEISKGRERLVPLESSATEETAVRESFESARANAERAEEALDARRTEWVRDRQEAETKRNALRGQYTDLRDQRERLTSLGDEGVCPTCMRPLGESYRTVIDMLDSQMETVRVDGNYFRSRVEQLEVMPPDIRELDEAKKVASQNVSALERRLAQVQAQRKEAAQLMRDLEGREQRLKALRAEIETIPGGYDAVQHDAMRREMERLTPLEARASRLRALLERAPELEANTKTVAVTVASWESRLAELRESFTDPASVEKEHAALRTAHEFAASQLHQAEVASASAQSDSAAADAALGTAQRERDEMEEAAKKLAALQLQRRMHDELDRTFSDLRTDLNFQLRPELSELASAFLRDLTDGRYSEMELDDEYRVLVLEDGIPKPVISGGEEDLANLSLRLAISQMIAERAGQNFSLLVLDEVFGSLDERRRRGVVELLRRVHDRFEQVILITHVETVREGLDRTIAVSYDEETGASVVTELENQNSVPYDEVPGLDPPVSGHNLAELVSARSSDDPELSEHDVEMGEENGL